MMVATQPKWERPTKMALLPTPSWRSPSFFLAASGSRRGSGFVFRRSVAYRKQTHLSICLVSTGPESTVHTTVW